MNLADLEPGTIVRFVNEHADRLEQAVYPASIVKVGVAPWYGGPDRVWVVPIWQVPDAGFFAKQSELHPLPEVRVPRRVSRPVGPALRGTIRNMIWRMHWYVDASSERGGYLGWIPATHRAAVKR